MKALYRIRSTVNYPISVNNQVLNPGKGILATFLTEEIIALRDSNQVHVKPLNPVADSDVNDTLPTDLVDNTGGVADVSIPAFSATYTKAELDNFAATIIAQVNGISTQVTALLTAINADGGFDASFEDRLQNVIDQLHS